MIRYLFAAAGSAVCLPAIRKIGVGWFSSISALLLVLATVGLVAAIRWGKTWREAVDARHKAKSAARVSISSGDPAQAELGVQRKVEG